MKRRLNLAIGCLACATSALSAAPFKGGSANFARRDFRAAPRIENVAQRPVAIRPESRQSESTDGSASPDTNE